MAKKSALGSRKYFVGVDLGGTKILAGVLNDRFDLRSECKMPVEPNRGEKVFLRTVYACIEKALHDARVTSKQVVSIGMGCPGMIDFPRGVIKLSPNISFLNQYPLQKKIADHFKVPVLVENDVNAGLYGEQQFGAARGHAHVAGIFLGTGVGGAFIFDGRLYRGATGAAGEIGHTFLAPPSMLSPNKRATTVEGLLGRLVIASESALLVMKQRAPHLYKEVGYDARKIKSKALLKSIRGGDGDVKNLLLQKAKLLGLAMANVVNLLNPEIIVLGGGVIEAMDRYLLPKAEETMRKYAMGPIVKDVKVRVAKLGDYSIVKGSAKLAFDVLGKKGN